MEIEVMCLFEWNLTEVKSTHIIFHTNNLSIISNNLAGKHKDITF